MMYMDISLDTAETYIFTGLRERLENTARVIESSVRIIHLNSVGIFMCFVCGHAYFRCTTAVMRERLTVQKWRVHGPMTCTPKRGGVDSTQKRHTVQGTDSTG
jgi:hypothetical protein